MSYKRDKNLYYGREGDIQAEFNEDKLADISDR